MDPCGERSDKRFQFLHGVLVRLVHCGRSREVPGSAEVARVVCAEAQRHDLWLSQSHQGVPYSRGRENCGPIPWAGVPYRLLTLDDHYHSY